MEAQAKYRNIKGSERKMRLVVDTIRGKNVGQALAILKHTQRSSAHSVYKTLLSAVANWEQMTGIESGADSHGLYVKTAFVDGAGMLKRFQPAPHGRAHRIRKRSCHLTIVVDSKVPVEN
ncbi:MAG TPA: 50S ribosomal protein L22 [Saprospiraceae bacterium]|jgi:large subunit ribosomal protein L22|nr:MAG: 50S ribosomal protein L22 [Candidatus Parvibacillus calidus]MBX2937588.1 50S ribosomal protein L22 [Saprospiraceae bacterium]HPF29029.1 50S ribosomal protein L22 [Lachnospiraceae bacterium]MBK7741871.1 50S ribosomal protein L22 [Candidatus Parvibacillus calidus]MBX7177921.1 50S ribosomal protein L22 [Saprospiraceae bacterium]